MIFFFCEISFYGRDLGWMIFRIVVSMSEIPCKIDTLYTVPTLSELRNQPSKSPQSVTFMCSLSLFIIRIRAAHFTKKNWMGSGIDHRSWKHSRRPHEKQWARAISYGESTSLSFIYRIISHVSLFLSLFLRFLKFSLCGAYSLESLYLVVFLKFSVDSVNDI